jgi:ATP-dependent Clp protease ATP-binding subunit ClpB
MNTDLFTEKAREAIIQGQQLAEERRNSQLEPEHLLLALVRQEDGVAPRILERLRLNPQEVAQEVERQMGSLPMLGAPPSQLGASPRLRLVLERAREEMRQLKDDYLSTEHLLLAMTDRKVGGGVSSALRRYGITHEAILQALNEIRGHQRVSSQNPEATYESLQKYGRDLTEMARQGKLDPVIGRDEEVRREIQQKIVQPLALQLLQGTFHDGDHIVVDVEHGHFTFRRQAPIPPPEAPANATASI